MINRIKTISNSGLVTFITDAGKETTGTRSDCSGYGYKTLGGKCYAFEQRSTKKMRGFNQGRSFVSKIVGYFNKVGGFIDSFILGNNNVIEAEKSVVIGNYGLSTTNGQIVFSAGKELGRNQFSIVQFSGQTTDAAATQLTTVNGDHFYFAYGKKAVYLVDMTALGYTTAGSQEGDVYTQQRKYVFSYETLRAVPTLVASSTGTVLKDTDPAYAVSLTAVQDASDTFAKDYIKVQVEGEASQTVEWQIVLQITQLHI